MRTPYRIAVALGGLALTGCAQKLPMAEPVSAGPNTAQLRFATNRRDGELIQVNVSACPAAASRVILASPDTNFWAPKKKGGETYTTGGRIRAGAPFVFEVHRSGDCISAGSFTPQDQGDYEVRYSYQVSPDSPPLTNIAIFRLETLGPNQVRMAPAQGGRVIAQCDLKTLCSLGR